MTRPTRGLVVFVVIVIAFSCRKVYAGTYTAASCNESDVNAVINGPTHTAVAGDVINIPSCPSGVTWTTYLTISVGITLAGAGQGQTVLLDGYTGRMIQSTMSSSPQTFRLTGVTIQPARGLAGSNNYIASITGTCDSSSCSQIRLDHLTISGWSNSMSYMPFTVDNVFGVIDHNTETSTALGFININLSSYKGVGTYGDNSWAQPDSYGSANALYIENNTFTNTNPNVASLTDCDGNACRFVVRFNNLTNLAVGNHGTESPGRKRGGRQEEYYNNTVTFNGVFGTPLGARSGVALSFNNTVTGINNGAANSLITLNLQRNADSLGGWGTCDGTGPWDINDGQVTEHTGTVTSSSGSVITDTGASFKKNEFAPNTGGLYYTLTDTTAMWTAGIESNTANTITVVGAGTITNGDTYTILGTTEYDHGSMTGTTRSTTLTDSTKTWTASQWLPSGSPYSVKNTTQWWGSEITANSSNTITMQANQYGGSHTWTNGDSYVILRSTACIDQDNRGQGKLLSGTVPVIGFPNDALDSVYEWMDSLPSAPPFGIVSPASAKYLANRDYYNETLNQTAQTSPSSPFNGTSGTGHGTLANRPKTCTPRVAYWATDTKTLYLCTGSPGTWTAHYTPYMYPHPLTQGVLNPPSNLQAVAR